jgi:hypothetical protein
LIFRGFTSARFGSVRWSTPFSTEAWTLSSSTGVGRVKLRNDRVYRRSFRNCEPLRSSTRRVAEIWSVPCSRVTSMSSLLNPGSSAWT